MKNDKKALFEITDSGGNKTMMQYILAFDYAGEHYHAFTPVDGQDDGECKVALCRKTENGNYEYADVDDDVFDEFCKQYELAENETEKENSLSSIE